jgi:hypothetical protein
MSLSMPPGFPLPSPPPAAVVEVDTPCRKCSYNVRALPVDGNCPECGTPIGAAIFGELLKFSLPTWVAGLRDGSRLVFIGACLVGGSFGLIFCLFIVAILAMWVMPSFFAFAATAALLLIPLGFVGGVTALIGWWLLTKPDPSGLGEDQYGTARRLIRISLAIWLIDLLLSYLIGRSTVSILVHEIVVAIDIAASVVFAVGLGAQFRYIEKISARLPDPQLSKQAHNLRNVYAIAYALMIIPRKSLAIVPINLPSGVRMAVECVSGLAALSVLTYFFRYFALMGSMTRRLSEETRASMLLWKQDAREWTIGPR